MIKYFLLFYSAALFCSCETVIDVPLKDADQRIVIEGNITNDTNSCIVKISKVSNFYSSNTFNYVSNAIVKIVENGTTEFILQEIAPGIYKSLGFVGIVGANYLLNVTVDGKEYLANSTMPAPVEIDSLTLEDNFFFGDTSKVLVCHFQDPVNVANNYRYFSLFQDSIGRGIDIDRDQFFNGENISHEVFEFSGNIANFLGDTVTVELWSIDAAVYDYLFTLEATLNAGSGQFASPANPNSNINNGALGYFSAHAISRKGKKLFP